MKQNKTGKGNAVQTRNVKDKCGIAAVPIEGLNERGINWLSSSSGVWAFGCEFVGDNLEVTDQQEMEECLGKCSLKTGCTHFTSRNGSCQLQRGGAGKGNAKPVDDKTVICGVL